MSYYNRGSRGNYSMRGRGNYSPSFRGGGRVRGGYNSDLGSPYRRGGRSPYRRGRGRGRGRRRGRGRGRMTRKEVSKPKFLKLELIKDVDTITSDKVKDLQIQDFSGQISKGFKGSAGKEIDVVMNFFSITMKIDKIIHYSVKIKPEIERGKARIGHQIFAMIKKELPLKKQYLFDGMKTLLTFESLDEVGLFRKTVEFNNIEYEISLEKAKEKLKPELMERKKIAFRAIIMKKILHELGYWQIGRNYYHSALSRDFSNQKLRVVLGFLSQLIQTNIGYLLNVDICYKPLRKNSILDMIIGMQPIEKTRESTKKFQENVEDVIVGKYAYCKHLGRNKVIRVDGISWDKNMKFKVVDRKLKMIMTMEELYRKKIRGPVNFKFQKQPLIWNVPSKIKRSGKVITDHDKIFYPTEIMFLCGVPNHSKSNWNFMNEYLNYTKLNPETRIKRIFQIMRDQEDRFECRERLSGFGIAQHCRLLKLKARVLPKQELVLTKEIKPQVKGSWDVIKPLFRKQTVDKWLIVHGDLFDRKIVNTFVNSFTAIWNDFGVAIVKPIIAKFSEYSVDAIINSIQKSYDKSKGNHFIMIVLNKDSYDLYGPLKGFLTTKFPVLSQVILEKTMTPPTDIKDVVEMRKYNVVVKKIFIQVQSKLGGSPWAMRLGSSSKLMVCGLDLTRRRCRKTQKRIYTIGFVCTVNFSSTSFYSSTFIHEEGDDLAIEIGKRFKVALEKYKEGNKKRRYPDIIMFYRSGITHKQIAETVNFEVKTLRNVIDNIDMKSSTYSKPKLTFIAVLGRCHARFFVKDEDGKYTNPQPGTIVDHAITTPNSFEFYLNSAYPTRKTSLPTKYIVLINEPNLEPDKIHMITYRTTHMYFNHFGTIRIPNTCKYAQKIARLVGRYELKEADFSLSNKLWYL